MHDWSAMRKTWQDSRDGMKVPKGATKASIGDAIKRVAVAQAKGLKPFVAELTKFDASLNDIHQAQMQARVGGPTATQDLSVAADASARAQGKSGDSMSLALVKEDAARIGDVFKDWMTGLTDIAKICDTTAKLYGQDSKITVATKLAALSTESTDLKTKILALPKRKTWGDVLGQVRVLESDAKVWMSALDDVRPAAAARIGA